MTRLVVAGLVVCGAGLGALPPLVYVSCLRAPEPITVDGVMSEAAWDTARPVTDFRLWDETLGEPTESTSVRFCYDDENLYAFFECDDPDLFALNRGRDARIWESDCVELFLWPKESSPIYYEFEVSPENEIFDARFVNSGSGGFARWAAWDCEVRTAVAVRGTVNDWQDEDEGYSVEMAIPLGALRESIGYQAVKGQTWRFAAVRCDMSVTLEATERSATANVPDGDIHGARQQYFTLRFK